MPTYYLIPLLMAVGWAFFFIQRSRVQKAGGMDVISRTHLNRLFRLPEGEQVTAAWSAITVPELNKGERAAEVIGTAAAVLVGVGVGVRITGRKLAIACTTADRVLLIDRENDAMQALGSGERPRFSETGKSGTKRTSQTELGWVDGAIVRLEIPGEDPIEIDVMASAVPVLVAWSRGERVAHLTGPYPMKGTI